MHWSFRATSDHDVTCPLALEAGLCRIVGKRHDADEEAYVVAEPTSYTLTKRQAAQLRAYFAKALAAGHLAPADAATAEAFGVPFTPDAPASSES